MTKNICAIMPHYRTTGVKPNSAYSERVKTQYNHTTHSENQDRATSNTVGKSRMVTNVIKLGVHRCVAVTAVELGRNRLEASEDVH